jgi:hypothetical protein
MATQYALPPWLAGRPAPNPAEAFISNIGHGVAIGQEATRAANEFAMQSQRIAAAERKQAQDDEREQAMLQFKQQQLQEQSMIEQQKLEVEKSYREQQGMLRSDALKQQQAKVELAARTAAAKVAAQKQYTDTMSKIAQLEDAGSITTDQADTARRKTLMQFGPSMGAPLGSLAQLGKPGFTPRIEMVTGPDGQTERVLRRSPETVELLDKRAAPAKISVGPMGTTIVGPQSDPAIKKAMADAAAAAAPATNAPGKLAALARAFGFEGAPASKVAPATAAAATNEAAAPKAQFVWNPKTRKIEAVSQGTPPPPPPPTPGSTEGDQTDLSDMYGDLPPEEEADTTAPDDNAEEDDLEE